MEKVKVLLVAALLVAANSFGQTAPTFSQVIVFGDSLSDDGNDAHRTRNAFGISYPSSNFNYSDYRFTNDINTDPATMLYRGTWHEQLEKQFLGFANAATNSADGGTDYAFGGATTQDGQQTRTLENNPFPFSGGTLSVQIDNMGQQVSDYLASVSNVADANALYIVWGGGNDLFDDHSAANVTATAGRVAGLIQRLANAGARNFLVPNVPPLGAVPNSQGDQTRVAQLDQASLDYRNQLNSALAAEQSMLATGGINIQLYVLDVWLNTIRVIGEPGKYGFTNVKDSSQGQSVNPDHYLFWDDLHPTTAGHHFIASEAFRVLSGQVQPLATAGNISTRGDVGTGDNVLIAGFIVNGSNSKTVIVRAIGPSLTQYGLSGVLADPTVTIYDSNHNVVATNDNWKDTQQSAIMNSGHAPPNDAESAIIATLPPGSYTAVVSGANSSTGIALAEVYDLSPNSNSVLENVSTRGFVGTGDDVLIAGINIRSGEPALLVLRAIGPSLSTFGIANPLPDPTLELHDANGALLSANDDWKQGAPTGVKAVLLAPGDNTESAIIASLSAGNYTAIVAGKNGATGIALVEAYRIQ